jgi:hypothetical protein
MGILNDVMDVSGQSTSVGVKMRQIDLKYHTDGTAIIKSTNGQVVPEEEPMILFRARDWLAVPLLEYYRKLCVADGCNDHQMGLVDQRIQEFKTFIQNYPERMKQPGITRGL